MLRKETTIYKEKHFFKKIHEAKDIKIILSCWKSKTALRPSYTHNAPHLLPPKKTGSESSGKEKENTLLNKRSIRILLRFLLIFLLRRILPVNN